MIDETAPVLHRAAHTGSRNGAGPEPETIATADDRIRATGTVAALQDRFPGAPEALRILTPGTAEAESGAQVSAATGETYR
ncbi:hypothetical protein CG723_41685 [Streptomyces sp. CB01635]|uniref:hypothetical protein n=1 Tax=unclassified Streptomyces TaxID=2593676 RepID=UPI000C2701DB|nr:hypothetical protein [Streptomyces sp. CB01635]PJN05961.1 hypothetical protein CG723_41685 [Streptomyces sp. CB01635]